MSAIVFGGSSGIGQATARQLAERDLPVVIADLTPATDEPHGISFVECDVRDEDDVDRACRFAAAFGDPEVMVYSAGVQIAHAIEDTTQDDLDHLFGVNTFGVIHATRRLLRYARGGSITLVASIAGLTSGGPGLTGYGASKAAVIGYTRSLALELAPSWRVNCVCPGWTETAFNAPVIGFMGGAEVQVREIADTVPLGRQASPREIAASITFMALDATYTTGHVFVADGGLTV